MASKYMKTLNINGNKYEIMDEYARNNSSSSFKNVYSFKGITLADIPDEHKNKYLTFNNATIGSKFNNILSITNMSGHVVYTTEIKSGDSILTTNAHTLASDYVPNMYVFDEESTLVDIVNYVDLNSTKKYVFENDGFIYMCFDYTAVHAGEFFYIKKPSSLEPFVLDANKTSEYESDTVIGDAAMEAIMTGKQIMVRTPNADDGEYTAIYSPVLTYQLPNYMNNYLYLFYLRDEKQNINLSAMGMGTIQVPVYGQLKLKLTETYNQTPLL